MGEKKEVAFLGQNNLLDYVLIIFSLLVLFVTTLYFYQNTFISDGKERPGIGRILLLKNDIRLKSVSSLSWQAVNSHSVVHESDSIFSGENSNAVVELNSSALVRLGANTMIEIVSSKQRKTLNLKIKSGFVNVTGNESQKINIEHKDKSIEMTLTKGEYKFSKTEEGISVEVFKGEAKIDDSGMILHENSLAHIDQKDVVVSELEYSLLAPTEGEVIVSSQNSVSVKISKPAKKNVTLLFSRYENFSTPIKQTLKVGEDSVLLSSLEEGLYFLKLVDSEQKDLTLSYNFSYFKLPLPVLYSPKNSDNLIEGEVNFSWSEFTQKDLTYEFQLATDKEFSSLLIHEKLKASSFGTKLKANKYFWRVRSIHQDQLSPWSEIFVVKLRNEKLEAIEVDINPKLSVLKNKSVHIVLTLKSIERPHLYKIRVIHHGSKILEKDSFNDSIEFDLLETGEYSIDVEAYNNSNNLIGENRHEKLVVIPFVPLPAPRLKVKEIELELDSSFKKILKGVFDILFPSAYAKNDRVAFEWENIEGAKSYRFIIASDKEFSNITESFDIPDNRFEWVRPKVGYFFWKVRAIDQFGYDGDESAVGTMLIRSSFTKNPPPVMEGDLKEKEQSHVLNLKWNLIQNAKYYVLRFIDNENHETFEETSDPVLAKEIVEDVRVQIKAVSKSGKETVYSNEYQWKVPRKEIPVVAAKVELYEDFTYSRRDLSLLHFDYKQIGTSNSDLKAAKFDNIGILAGGDYHLPIHSKPHLFYFIGGNVLMTRVVGDKLSQNLYFTEFSGGLNQKHQNIEWGGGIAFSYVNYLETPETVSGTTLFGLPFYYVLFNQSKFQEKIYLKPYISGSGNFLIKFDVTYFFKEKLGTTFYYFQDKYPLPNDISASSSGLGLGLTWVN